MARPPHLHPRLTRRSLLGGAAAGGLAVGTGLWPRPARALSPGDRKFIFVFANGGWDPTRAMYPAFHLDDVEMEVDASTLENGALQTVSHPNRPKVDAFFDTWADETVLIHGIQVPAIDHFTCVRLATTHSPSADRPDFAAALAGAQADLYAAPQLMLGGPSFPGVHNSAVVRTGFAGQLGSLLDPTSTNLGNVGSRPFSDSGQEAIDAFLASRRSALTAAATDPKAEAMWEAFEQAEARTEILRSGGLGFDLGSLGNVSTRMEAALTSIANGASRVVSLEYPSAYDSGNRDTHSDNDADQGMLFNVLLGELDTLLAELAATPGEVGDRLLDEVVVVVFSEMGRSPLLDASGGKGHWPYTTTMLLGGSLGGGRAIGDYDELYGGVPVDPETGELDEGGVPLTPGVVGATLMMLGDVDPSEDLPGVSPLSCLG